MEDILIQSYLAAGEKLLWSGVPTRKVRLGQQHLPLLFMVPFLLLFLTIPVLGILDRHPAKSTASTAASTSTVATNDQANPPAPEHKSTIGERIVGALFFVLFFGSFAGFILYTSFRQVFGSAFGAGSTLYAITDQRIVIVTGKSKKVVTSLLLSTVAQVQMQQWPDGLGTITFGPRPVWPNNTGWYVTTPSLENISDSTKVFQLIARSRSAG